jgi:hypothetical protein
MRVMAWVMSARDGIGLILLLQLLSLLLVSLGFQRRPPSNLFRKLSTLALRK